MDALPADSGGFGLTQRVVNQTCELEGEPPVLGQLRVERALQNSSFNRPIDLTYAPDGTDRIFIVEQQGRIRVLDTSRSTPTLFLDIASRVTGTANEEGLLGLAFHPDYAQNGYFYVYYSVVFPRRRSVIARYSVSAADANRGDTASELKILEIEQPYSNHNGGKLAFGPDGYLYIGVGDGGSGGDPDGNGQNRRTLLGTILRIDVDNPQSGLQYGVPRDNPFVGVGGGVREEIWAYGLRNPWRFSFDRVSGDLWAGDVGQNAVEEIDLVTRGGNYGWRGMEGNRCYDRTVGCPGPDFIAPVIDYQQGGTHCSVTGGVVYRGSRLPELYGAYIYGDYCSGVIWALWWDGTRVTDQRELVRSGLSISAFGEDENGELYIVDLSGGIYQLARRSGSGGSGQFPTTLTRTGCYSDLANQTPVAAAIPYSVNAPLWSDGTTKRRYMVLPGQEKIRWRDPGVLDLPDGTILIKEFLIELEVGNPATLAPIETRFMVRRGARWSGYAYRWNDGGTEGTLLSGSATVTITRRDGAGTERFNHYIPSPAECRRCHTDAAGGALGLHAGQINRDHDYGGVVDNQLRAMTNIELFELGLPGPPSSLARFPEPSDRTADIAARARSYMHGNCAHCHLPGGPTTSQIDLRFHVRFADTNSCNAQPVGGDLGVAGARVVVPGSPSRSLMWLRVNRRGPGQMPPLATKAVDVLGSQVISEWIDAIDRCP